MGWHWVAEEHTHPHTAITGETNPLVRSDMMFFEAPNGGAVFSTSSIAWSFSLAHDDYRDNVSQITQNVLRRFLDPKPFLQRTALLGLLDFRH